MVGKARFYVVEKRVEIETGMRRLNPCQTWYRVYDWQVDEVRVRMCSDTHVWLVRDTFDHEGRKRITSKGGYFETLEEAWKNILRRQREHIDNVSRELDRANDDYGELQAEAYLVTGEWLTGDPDNETPQG